MVKIQTIVLHDGPQGTQGPAGTNIYVQPGDPGAVPDGTLWLDTDDPGPPSIAAWGNITGTLSSQTDLNTALTAKAPLASPALTGTPTAPTASPGTNTTQLATTAYADAGLAAKAPLASPALTGTPTAPTATVGTNTTQIATTAFVLANGGSGGSSPLTTKGDLYGYSTTGARVPVGSDGQVLVADSTQATGLVWGPSAMRQVRIGAWLESAAMFGGNQSLSGASLGANSLLFVPVLVDRRMTFDTLGLNVRTASTSGNLRFGVFTIDINTLSNALVLDAGTVSSATTGFKTVTISGGLVLAPGLYWLAMFCDQAVTVDNLTGTTGGFGYVDMTLAPTGSATVAFISGGAGRTYGPFASSYTGLATRTNDITAFAHLGIRRSA